MERHLLRRYRDDRRKLLDFILSTGLAAEVRPPPGVASLPDVDLDVVSADYVLERAKSGGVLDLSEASRRYREELEFPVMISSHSGNLFFLNSEPEISGPPPLHLPPHLGTGRYCQTSSSRQKTETLHGSEYENFRSPDSLKCIASTSTSHPSGDGNALSLGLPTLTTGLSDDDIREAAYEILLAAVLFSGSHVNLYEDKQKEKKSRFLTGLRTKKERAKKHNQLVEWHSEIPDVIRVQMEISEITDACIKQGLMRFHTRFTDEHIDVLQIILELLSNVYKSDFCSEKMYRQWQKRQANVIEELFNTSINVFANFEYELLKHSIAKLRDDMEGNFTGNSEYAENIAAIRKFASRLSRVPGKFGIQHETFYWTSCYHFNVRLYTKLLFSIFDILEDDQMLEEWEELLSVFRLVWPMLGITQMMHDTLFSWVLLYQHICTGETKLLDGAKLQIQRALSSEVVSEDEKAYMNSLLCLNEANGKSGNLNLLNTALLSVKTWCDSQLQDYHLHFNQNVENFEMVADLAVSLGLHFAGSFDEKNMSTSELLKGFIESSITASCRRIFDSLSSKDKSEGEHHLALLADDLKLIAEREFTTFTPTLSRWYPQAGSISSVLLHNVYGRQLMPFLESISDMSGSARSVLPAADALERCLSPMLFPPCEENGPPHFVRELTFYKIGVICRPLLLQWINAQHDNVLKWTERAILIEDWEPLSSHKRQAASTIEVFRIIEENVDQFFNFYLPMDIIHLRSLLIGIFQCLDTYLVQMANELGEKRHLYPNLPALTRHKEVTSPFVKKKSIEYTILDEKIVNQLGSLTAPKLCVRLNTLHYIRDQVDALEESIKKSWEQVCPVDGQLVKSLDRQSDTSESIDELFTIFDEIRRTSFDVGNMIYNFIGTRIIFWDMRDPFLFSLYRQNVENSRLDIVLQQLDSILNNICDLVIDTMRDQVILSICRASMEGFVWILLDGGPSRVFSEMDISLVQEDLSMLKELFIANGEGLLHDVVEKEAKLAQKILDIYDFKTETIIEMLMSASEHISIESDSTKLDRCATDVDTLLRILCHKKDRKASKFLKRHYHLPKSSEYDDNPGKGSPSKSPFMSDILKSTSFRWSEKGQKSLSTMKQRFQAAAAEIKYSRW